MLGKATHILNTTKPIKAAGPCQKFQSGILSGGTFGVTKKSPRIAWTSLFVWILRQSS